MNVGLAITAIGGGGTPAAGISGALTATNAPNIFDLEGVGFSGGGSFGFGTDIMSGTARDGSAVMGIQVAGFGVSAPLPEGHGELTTTAIASLNWLPTWMKDGIIASANNLYNNMLTDSQKKIIEGS